jgi:hypothetical protein
MDLFNKQIELQVKDTPKSKKQVLFAPSSESKHKPTGEKFDKNKLILFKGIEKKVLDIEEDRMKREIRELKSKRRRDNWDVILFILSTVLFLIGVFQQFDITKDHYITTSLRSYFGFGSEDNVKYILSGEVKKFFFDNVFDKTVRTQFFFLDRKFEIISSIRLTGRRPIYDNNSTTILRTFNYTSYFKSIGNDDWTQWHEDTASYTVGPHTYTYSDKLSDSYRGLGGYVIGYSNKDLYRYDPAHNLTVPGNLVDDPVYTENQIELLRNKISDYFEGLTTITIDLVVANLEVGCIVPIVFKYVYSKTGVSEVSLEINVMQKDLYERRSQYFRGAVEVLYTITVIIYLIFLIRGFSKQMNVKAEKHFGNKEDKTEEIKLDTVKQEDYDDKIGNTAVHRKKAKTKWDIIKKLIYKNMLDAVHIFSLCLSLICIILWIILVVSLYAYRERLVDAIFYYENILSYDMMNHYLFTTNALSNYKMLTAFNFLFYFIRLIRILANYVTTTEIFLDTIKVAASDLFSFFILFLNILLALTIHNYFFYGRYLPEFDNFAKVIQQNLSFIMGTADPMVSSSMYLLNSTITLLYFLMVIILTRYQIIILLMAIILYYFKSSVDNYYSLRKDITGQDLTVEQIIKKSPKDPVNELLKKFRKVISCAYCKRRKRTEIKFVETEVPGSILGSPKSKRKASFKLSIGHDTRDSITKIKRSRLKNIAKSDEKAEAHGINMDYKLTGKDLALFNSEFNENFAITLRNPYFDSQNDFIKLKYYYESKYRTSFINAILYLLFLGTLILTFLFNDQTPWRSIINKALEHKFSQNFTYLNTELNRNETHNFFTLDSSSLVRHYLFTEFPNYFERTDLNLATLMGTNVVLKNSFIATVRKAQSNPTYDYNEGVRMYLDLDKLDVMKHENITWLKLGVNNRVKNVFYNDTESYRNIGGYTYNYNLVPRPNVLEESKALFLDSFFTFTTIEFIMENPEYQVLIYVEAFITQDYGTKYNNYFNTYIITYNYVRDGYAIDYIKVISELGFVFLTVYIVINFLRELVNRINSYDKWYKEQIMKLSDKSKEVRNILKPEILRKMRYVMDVAAFYDVLVIGLSVYYISLIVARLSLKMTTGDNYQVEVKSESIWDTRSQIYQLVDVENMFDVVGSILIFLSSVKLLIMLNFGKYFSLLIRTVKESTTLNINFVALLLLIQPAFVTFAYFMFGTRAELYSSLGSAAMSSLNIIFGYTDYKVFYQSDPRVGPLFFFLYVFVIKMILINLFLALIYNAYTKVKEKIRHTVEIYSLKRTYLFCCYKKKDTKKLNNKGEIETTFEIINMPVRVYLII